MWKLNELGPSNLSVSMDVLHCHSTTVTEIHFSPIHGHLSRAASGSHDGTLHLYHGSTGKILNKMSPTTADVFKGVPCFIFSPSGELLASGCNDGSCHIWDGLTGAHSNTLIGHSGVQALVFTRDSQYLASGGDDTIRIWDVTSGQCLTLLPVSDIVMFLEVNTTVTENPLLLCGTYDGVIRVMELIKYDHSEKGMKL